MSTENSSPSGRKVSQSIAVADAGLFAGDCENPGQKQSVTTSKLKSGRKLKQDESIGKQNERMAPTP